MATINRPPIPFFNDISVDVTAALINWQGFCELHDLDAVDTLADVPEILYVPIEVSNYGVSTVIPPHLEIFCPFSTIYLFILKDVAGACI